ncbi:MAG: hypothetical protein ABWY36_05395 [Leifsonia sp.]
MSETLQQGDVKIGDRVRFPVDGWGDDTPSIVEGEVTETAADGGVVGINVGGVTYSAGLTSVTLLSRAGERELTVTAKALEKNKMFGFRSEAASGGADDITFELDHSFGMGSLALMLTVKRDGKTIGQESINLSPLVQRWVNAIVEGE